MVDVAGRAIRDAEFVAPVTGGGGATSTTMPLAAVVSKVWRPESTLLV